MHLTLIRSLFFIVLISQLINFKSFPQLPADMAIRGTEFYFQDKPFPYNGISFFNALYNPTFNQSDSAREVWLKKLNQYGINVIRVWAQSGTPIGYS